MVNRFIFKEALSEYTNGFQTANGQKLPTRKHELRDPIDVNADPIDPKVPQ